MATVAELLDISLPDDAGEDSISFLSTLTGFNNSLPIRTDIIYHSSKGVFVIRQGDWKLIVDCENSGDGGRGVNGNKGTGPDPSMKGQLYNLAEDPFELFNLIDRNKTREKELRNILEQYKERGRSASR